MAQTPSQSNTGYLCDMIGSPCIFYSCIYKKYYRKTDLYTLVQQNKEKSNGIVIPAKQNFLPRDVEKTGQNAAGIPLGVLLI